MSASADARLSETDAALVSRDPALPGLPVLLDDARLSAWLEGPVRRRYLRYKPGTSCVLAATVADRQVFVTAYTEQAVAKLDKTVRARPAAVQAVDRDLLLVAALPAGDRDLPALARLLPEGSREQVLHRLLPGRDLRGALLQPLVHKPQRRWVGLLCPAEGEPVVLRAYRGPDAAAAARLATRRLAGGSPRTPALLGQVRRLGLSAVEWLPGRPLDLALREGRAGDAELAAAGTALARLHARRPARLPARDAHEDRRTLRAAAAQLGILVPSLGARAAALSERLAGPLAQAGPVCTLHGDFSLDQVVLLPAGSLALIDLDRAVLGPAASDLAGLPASLQLAALLPGSTVQVTRWTDALLAGYAAKAELPPAELLAAHTSAALLRRSVEPFRSCLPGWAAGAERLLDLAEQAAP